MILLRLAGSLLALSLAVALSAPAGAEQVFEHVSTGRLQPLPTPNGYAAYYDGGYYYPCYWYGGGGPGFGNDGRSHGHGISNTGTINGERFYPYDPRSGSGHHGWSNGWNCWMNQGSHRYPQPRPTRLPIPNPPRRVPQSSPYP